MYLFYINHISEEQQMYEEKRTGYINSIQDMLMKFAAQFKLQQKEKADALDILNQMEEVTSQDVEDIRNFMSNVAELETEASKLKTDEANKYSAGIPIFM